MEAFAIFEGGGAKGYAHVGALKAAEERGIVFRKLAGTSAGAIIAALVAAGYTADELYDPSRPPGERGVLDLDPLDILDRKDYAEIRRLIASAGRMARPARASGASGLRGRLSKYRQAFKGSRQAMLIAQALLLAWNRKKIRSVFKHFGMTDHRTLSDWLDQRLRDKLGHANRPVTFADLGMRLRVVAANVRTGLIKEFGTGDQRDEPVAPAVVASACFPFFFTPLRQGDELYVDGGLVSNLPAWVFDDDRENDPRFVPTIAFRLVDDPLLVSEPTIPTTMLEFTRRIIQTLVSGSRKLEERRIDDYYGIDLTAAIPTLSFGELRERAGELVSAGYECVRRFFRENIGPQDPVYMSSVLRTLVAELRSEYDWPDKVRAAVILPTTNGQWARICYSAFMDSDGDDRLRVRVDGLGIGTCFRLREPIYIKRDSLNLNEASINKYEIGARPADMKYTYVIPIFVDPADWQNGNPLLRAEPFAALVIDKAEEFGPMLLDEDQQDALANVAAIIGEQVRDQALTRQPHTPNKNRNGPTGWSDLDASGGIQTSQRKLRDIGDGPLGTRLVRTIRRLTER